jgi:large subunit ribosomal protein L10
MPTDAKRGQVADLADRIKRATITIATDFSGLRAKDMTELRKKLRAQDVEYRVVKNRLALLAATEAGAEPFKELLEGSTGVIFGYGDAIVAAKALDEFIKETRSTMTARKGVMDGEILTGAQLLALANLPSKDELIARLLGQMNAPITGLVSVLSGPIRGLAFVLQRRSEQLAAAG